MTANRGHGTAFLPAEYVRDQVRLGYAATEHGVQGDTTTVGIELVSPATTRRGAYVGLTRGRVDNTVLVVTDSHDLDEARDVLDRIVSVDRADVPATTQRRELAAADRSPRRPQPRCEIPDWLPDLRNDIGQQIADIERRGLDQQAALHSLRSQLVAAEQEQARAQRRLDPHRPRLDAAHTATRAAQERAWAISGQSLHLKGRHRRAADRDHRDAQQELAEAKQYEAAKQHAAAPAREAVHIAATRVGEVRQEIRSIEIFQRWDTSVERVGELRAALRAIDDWEHWATGQPMRPAQILGVIKSLRADSVADDADCAALATAVDRWARPRGIVAPAPAISVPQPPAPSFGIEL